jgi:hypothetical protein
MITTYDMGVPVSMIIYRIGDTGDHDYCEIMYMIWGHQ